MAHIRPYALAAVLLSTAVPATAGDIVRWMDADGVTHFGNPQFGPSHAEQVEVAPANGMDVPEGVTTSSSRGGPVLVKIDKKPNRQVIGFRGYQWTLSQNPRRHHRR